VARMLLANGFKNIRDRTSERGWRRAAVGLIALVALIQIGRVIVEPAKGFQTRWIYSAVRQEIEWKVEFVNDNGTVKAKTVWLDVTEITAGVDGTEGQVDTPLRIIDSSHGSGEVFKVGYPAKPGVARKDADPFTDGAQDDFTIPGDQRAEPVNPIPDWETKVKAIDK
jgi:hypothetical protein